MSHVLTKATRQTVTTPRKGWCVAECSCNGNPRYDLEQFEANRIDGDPTIIGNLAFHTAQCPQCKSGMSAVMDLDTGRWLCPGELIKYHTRAAFVAVGGAK